MPKTQFWRLTSKCNLWRHVGGLKQTENQHWGDKKSSSHYISTLRSPLACGWVGPSCLLRPPWYFLSADWIITFWFHIHPPRLSNSQRNKCSLSSAVCRLTPKQLNGAGAVQKWSGLLRSSPVIADLRRGRWCRARAGKRVHRISKSNWQMKGHYLKMCFAKAC